jgi:signal transduction histidine kinase
MVDRTLTRLARRTGVQARDVAVVAVLLIVGILGTAHLEVDPGDRAPDGFAYLLVVLGMGSLAFWRRWSIVVTGVVAVVFAVYFGRGYPPGPAMLAGPLSLLALGYRAPRRVAWIGGAVLAVMAIGGHLVGDHDLGAYDLLVVGWALAAVLAGQALAARGERAAAERERAAHHQNQVRTTERLRLAQDLHDSVAHAMATINVQSGVAAHLLAREGMPVDPAELHSSLEAIRAASAAALDELGSILGVLREPGEATRAPTPDIGALGDLMERAEHDGIRVSADLTGDIDTVPPVVATAAYRVVQEALTNTRRHAGPGTTARVTVASGAGGALRVQVYDDGAGAPTRPATDGSGFGLIGMRERVEATGGRLDAAPEKPRGFRVVATWDGSPT